MNSISYAVVNFSDQNDEISEVPISWLTDDNKKCWWPNKKDVRPLINKSASPSKDWKLYDVEVRAMCTSLKQAQKMAEDLNYISSSECEKGRGKRIKKPNYLGDSTSDEDDAASNTTTKKLIPVPQLDVSLPQWNVQTFESENNNLSETVEPGVYTIVTVDNAETGGTESDTISDLPPVITPLPSELYSESHNLTQQLEMLNRNMFDIKRILQDIDNRLKNLETTQKGVEYSLLEKFIPAKDVPELDILNNNLLTNNDLQNQLALFIHSIGGSTIKDYIHRCWSRMLTNHVAVQCSWLGLRNNINVSIMEVTKCIKKQILHDMPNSTEHQFEKISSEWFRLAKQRLTRENKNKTDRLEN